MAPRPGRLGGSNDCIPPTYPLGPLDFIAKLAALVPPPRANPTRFHGVFAPNSRYRGRVVPGRRGRVSEPASLAEEPTPAERRASMTWAQQLKRIFGIDIKTCPACGGAVRIIACIEDPHVIKKILTHLARAAPELGWVKLLPSHASPQFGLFD